MNIETRVTPRRRCGYRRPGGLYLVAAGPAEFCGKLPVELSVCPCCCQGIKPARAWTWIDATRIFAGETCKAPKCVGCPIAKGLGRAGLLWVGSCYYPSPQTWTEEAHTWGVCRRIPAVPKDFVLGKTWVLVAHRQAITRFEQLQVQAGDQFPLKAIQLPGIFHSFRPSAIEYVVTGDETPEVLDKMKAVGITPVKDELPVIKELPLTAHDPNS